jgi:conjugal transfer mating pair stabilization protein TraN
MAALEAAGHSAAVVNAAGAAAGAGSIGVGMNTFIAATINPYTIAAGIAIKLAVDTFLSGSCDQQDLETGMLESSGRCHYVGEWCEKKWPLVGCVQKAKGYCCFNSKLARIIHEKGRPQLKAFQPAGAWGTEKPAGPNCRGFTSAEFQMLDFSKIDLSEYLAR